MTNLQTQLEKFHQNIKVDDNQTLREKREIICDKIKEYLRIRGKNYPIPEVLNQGSYIYGVGIRPLSGDFDIDVGLIFNIKSTEHSAKQIRELVFNTIKNHTSDVENKGPCIRIKYEKGYHVDLVCYAKYKNSEQIEDFQLAHRNGSWIPSNPKRIKEYIQTSREKFKNTKNSIGADQLQRVVRFLKRWIDLMYLKESDNKPTGLAILLYCIKVLTSSVYDSQGRSDDLQALIYINEQVRKSNRIIAHKPDTREDVFQKISNSDMKKLILKFQQLYNTLLDARNCNNLKTACELMREQFGDDFPGVNTNLNSKRNSTPMQNIEIETERPWRKYK